ncbi:MAG: hypothetical protein HFG27_02245 [Provencibacterium sp.]|nr:hypothetical protein [Provencibacterium sp.]
MPKRIKDQPNPYKDCIKFAVSTKECDYEREELTKEQFARVVIRAGLSAMLHLHDIGMLDADISGWALKPDKA